MEKKNRIWNSFLISFFIFPIGGIIAYLYNKKRDKQLGSMCLVASILHPFPIGYALVTLFGASGGFLAGVVFLLINLILIVNIFKKNPYRYFLPSFNFGVIGAVYSYFKYKGNKHMQKNVVIFVLATIVVILITVAIAGMLSYWASGFVQNKL